VARRTAKESSVEEVIDRLYSLDPEEFTGERNEAVKRLKADGDKDGSDLVRALRKPTAAAWAVNQLSRRAPKRVDELLKAGDALRRAQRAALSGGKGDLRTATRDRRAVVARLVDEAAAAFRDAGRNPDQHLDSIRSTLEAASADEETGELVRTGRLIKEVGPLSGFGGISPFEVLEGGRATPANQAAKKQESAATRRFRDRLQARVEKSEDALAAARDKAQEARRDADQAAKDVDRLERELQTARRRAERAQRAAEAAEVRAQESEQALDRAQADLKAES
jgi:hypothetical protein